MTAPPPHRFRHEVVAPGIHRFVFASESRRGVEHELLLDLAERGPARLSCLCEASLFGKLCKHKRFVILGGRRVRSVQRRRKAPVGRVAGIPARSAARKGPRRGDHEGRR